MLNHVSNRGSRLECVVRHERPCLFKPYFVDSFSPGIWGYDSKSINFKHDLWINALRIQVKITLEWMQGFIHGKSKIGLGDGLMSSTSHYINQCTPRSPTPYDFIISFINGSGTCLPPISNPLPEPMLAYCWWNPFEKKLHWNLYRKRNYSFNKTHLKIFNSQRVVRFHSISSLICDHVVMKSLNAWKSWNKIYITFSSILFMQMAWHR